MSEFNSIYTAYMIGTLVLLGFWVFKTFELSDFTVFAITESAVLWTIFRLLWLFAFTWDTTHLFAALLLVLVFGGVVFYFMPPFIRDILSGILANSLQALSAPKKNEDIEEMLKEGVPEE
jgi:hypothetical protein